MTDRDKFLKGTDAPAKEERKKAVEGLKPDPDNPPSPQPDLKFGDLRVVLKQVRDLTPAPWNPRTISEEAMEGLTFSIQKFGLVSIPVWNKRTKHIVGGHQRYESLMAEDRGNEMIPVVEVDLSEDEEKELNLTLNNPATQGQFTNKVQEVADLIQERFPTDAISLKLEQLVHEIKIPIVGMKRRDEKSSRLFRGVTDRVMVVVGKLSGFVDREVGEKLIAHLTAMGDDMEENVEKWVNELVSHLPSPDLKS